MKKIIVLTVFTWIAGAVKSIEEWTVKAIENIEAEIGTLNDEAKKFVSDIAPSVIQFLNLAKGWIPEAEIVLDNLLPSLSIPINKVLDLGIPVINELIKLIGGVPLVIDETTKIEDVLSNFNSHLKAITDPKEHDAALNTLAVGLADAVSETPIPENADVLIQKSYENLKSNLSVIPVADVINPEKA